MESNEHVSRGDRSKLKTSHEQDLGYQVSSLSAVDVIKTNATTNSVSNCDHDVCKRTIFVRNVPFSMTRNQLRDHFDKFGKIHKVKFVYNFKVKKCVGLAEIEYLDASSAVNAVTSPKDEHFYSGRCMKPYISRCKKLKRNQKQTNKQNGEDETDDSTPQNYFNDLPDEIINYIFSYLDFAERIRIERVCKRWQDVNTNNTWVDMNVLNLQDKFTTSNKHVLTNAVLVSILKRCGLTLREINFDCHYYKLTHGYSTEIAKYCPNLESANLSKTPIKVTAMKTLIEKCENLHTLKLQGCNGVGEKSLCLLLQKGKKIKYLDLSYNEDITGESFHLVNDRLETLILNGCEGLSSAHFLHLRNSRIKHLGINKCESLTSETLVTVITSLNSTLTALQMGGPFDQFSGDCDVFSRILKRCPNLQRLELEENYHVDFELIDLICKNCIQLRHINLNGTYLSDEDAKALCQLPHLRSICLNYMVDISNEFIIKLSLPGKLEHVELRGVASIEDYGCIVLIKNSPNLKLLDVSSCKNITNLIIGGTCMLERPDNYKLKIIAGGSGIDKFIDKDFVHVSSKNLCPFHYRPVDDDDDDVDYDEDDDDSWDDDDYGIGCMTDSDSEIIDLDFVYDYYFGSDSDE